MIRGVDKGGYGRLFAIYKMVRVPFAKMSEAGMFWSSRCWMTAPATAERRSLAVNERLSSLARSVASIAPRE